VHGGGRSATAARPSCASGRTTTASAESSTCTHKRLGEVVSVPRLAGHVLGLKEARDATNALDTNHRHTPAAHEVHEGLGTLG